MHNPILIHHGAIDGVTGSCHQYFFNEQQSVLIDCGLFQGVEQGRGKAGADSAQIDFPLEGIQALLLTHVHIDHAGRIPYLIAAGFNGPIYCSKASALLLPLVLEDALKMGITRDEKLINAFIKAVSRQLRPCDYNSWYKLEGSEDAVQLRFQNAGHILGSAYIEIRHQIPPDNPGTEQGWYKAVFSGDLGARDTPLLPDPTPLESANLLVLESTYGDKNHQDRKNRQQRLQQVLEKALNDNGTVLIPAFSIGRTQELLYELEDIIHRMQGQAIHQGLNWEQLDIIVDSPLAADFTAVYKELKQFWDDEAKQRLQQGRHPLQFEQLLTVKTHDDHQKVVRHLAETGRPAVVIAASGMCAGGRVVNYLKALLASARHQILFIGYQARGTPGAALLTYAKTGGYLQLDGEDYPIHAEVLQLSGYSAHADQQDLLHFVSGMHQAPEQIRLVHGDAEAKLELKKQLEAKGHKVVIGVA
ncbi:MAG: MBL fold metallo-hydrolase [Gammaproteobacteria bacterium]|nr:MBL fold metallo-hydrolase [Gammaproteobacteria bacterium]MBU2058436.1 MBL fold metallo-hydrolase [Gammaproteobacteria bacterium]MBU2176511.1 MBL fold metallo-hydrolase [Gammaproteobacteria bacterium]MBU2248547.1 MBL fold metallo-hydrolase [Gammaproteobacteria bacterium]MBU2345590.1 MBL fold metallo-hydrolase [Gammaproteobacteria bacterium]